ncbi:hypothetical protein ACOSP6_00140 [Tenacibaculum sp. MEBiC06402]|uniref:hypothetical protein n=1 Tax=unclassified Tenacibaculum TaxID=2635139 RepID=UPI003B9BB03C
MKILKLSILLLLIISCNEKKKSSKPEDLKIIETEKQPIINNQDLQIEKDTVHESYLKGKVEKYDWNLAFKKTENYQNISQSYSDKKQIPKDLTDFLNKFFSDYNFQKKHIDFNNLTAAVGACEETYILSKSNWIFDNDNFINRIGIDQKWKNTFKLSKNRFYYEVELIEIGVLKSVGFKKSNGVWKLNLYLITDC